MQLLNVNELIPHKKNGFFFDDIEGEPWIAFLESIETSGVIEPIIATQDKVIVSGHQRIRACKALGIEKVWTDIRTFDSEDEVLKQLIETNIRQRGVGNTNAVKLGRCIAELERIYGIKNGNNQHTGASELNSDPNPKSQSDLAEELKMSERQLRKYKSLTDLIPELQDAVQSGQITATTAMGFVKKLSPEEQAQLAEQISGKEKVTGSEVQQYIDELKAAREENAKLRTAISEQGARNAELQHKLENRPQAREIVKEVTVEVAPDDYEALKSQAKNADIYQKDFQRMQSEYEKMSEKWKQAEREKEQLIADRNKPDAEKAENLKRSALFFCAGVSNFIEKYGGYVWLTDYINDMDDADRSGYEKAISAIEAWVMTIKSNLEGRNE